MADLKELNKLTNNLNILKNNCPKYPRIIRKLKSDNANFFSNLSEVDVVSYYYLNHNKEILEYEPSVEGGKNLDLMLIGKNGVKYYFEIFTVLEDVVQQKYSEITNDINLAIDKLNLGYIILYKITEDFKSTYIPEFVDLVKKSLNKNNLNTNKIKFCKYGIKVAEFRIKQKGGGGGSIGPGSFIDPAGRVEKKILDKLHEQLPDNQNVILVINLSYGFPHFLAVDLALESIEYPRNIAIIIAYFGNNYKSNKKCYPNPNLSKKAVNDIIHDII